MTKQEFFEFLNAWKAVYYQWQYSDDAFDVLFEDFEEFEKPVVMDAFKEVRRNFERMPSMPEFRQVCLSHVKSGKRSVKKEIEDKFKTVPFLREYIVRQFDKWLAANPAEERDAIESRIVNVNPLLISLFQGDWRKGDQYVVEAAFILKEEEKAGRWEFDNADFFRYQERRKQENAERMVQTRGKLLYFPASRATQQQIEDEKKQRRDPEWRKKKVDVNEREHLQSLIQQRDLLKQSGGSA